MLGSRLNHMHALDQLPDFLSSPSINELYPNILARGPSGYPIKKKECPRDTKVLQVRVHQRELPSSP